MHKKVNAVGGVTFNIPGIGNLGEPMVKGKDIIFRPKKTGSLIVAHYGIPSTEGKFQDPCNKPGSGHCNGNPKNGRACREKGKKAALYADITFNNLIRRQNLQRRKWQNLRKRRRIC